MANGTGVPRCGPQSAASLFPLRTPVRIPASTCRPGKLVPTDRAYGVHIAMRMRITEETFVERRDTVGLQAGLATDHHVSSSAHSADSHIGNPDRAICRHVLAKSFGEPMSKLGQLRSRSVGKQSRKCGGDIPEVFNAISSRRELQGQRHRFRTHIRKSCMKQILFQRSSCRSWLRRLFRGHGQIKHLVGDCHRNARQGTSLRPCIPDGRNERASRRVVSAPAPSMDRAGP